MDDESTKEVNETNGHAAAPPILHAALDQLYRWMAETGAPDGTVTVRAKMEDQPFCVDLSLIAYLEKKEEASPPVEDPA